jgi:hypothetical protein
MGPFFMTNSRYVAPYCRLDVAGSRLDPAFFGTESNSLTRKGGIQPHRESKRHFHNGNKAPLSTPSLGALYLQLF